MGYKVVIFCPYPIQAFAGGGKDINIRRYILLLLLDTLLMVLLILLFTYFGMAHLILLFFGLLCFVMTWYDYRSAHLSEFFALLLGMSTIERNKKLNLLPILLSLIPMVYGFNYLFRYGVINTGQRCAMQEGQFFLFSFWFVVLTLFCLAALIGVIILKQRRH